MVVTAINYVGVRTAGRFQILLTSLKVAAVVAVVILGLTLRKILIALVPAMAAYNGLTTDSVAATAP